MRSIMAVALLSVMARPAAALEVTVKNCIDDGPSHEFVVAATDDGGNPENKETKVVIDYGKEAQVHCNNPESQKVCQVKMHGNQAWWSVSRVITFLTTHEVNDHELVACSK